MIFIIMINENKMKIKAEEIWSSRGEKIMQCFFLLVLGALKKIYFVLN